MATACVPGRNDTDADRRQSGRLLILRDLMGGTKRFGEA